jgi:hypothetical protein
MNAELSTLAKLSLVLGRWPSEEFASLQRSVAASQLRPAAASRPAHAYLLHGVAPTAGARKPTPFCPVDVTDSGRVREPVRRGGARRHVHQCRHGVKPGSRADVRVPFGRPQYPRTRAESGPGLEPRPGSCGSHDVKSSDIGSSTCEPRLTYQRDRVIVGIAVCGGSRLAYIYV